MYLFYGIGNAYPIQFKLYNFNSIKEKGIKMNLFPPNNLGAINEYDFDCRYAEFLMNDDIAFCNMMNLIMDLYNGIDVFILVDDIDTPLFDGWNLILVESFLKFIQQRYGINGTRIANHYDMDDANPTDFTDYGLYNLEVDKERYTFLMEKMRIVNGGVPYSE